jgi:UDP-glucose 4-epimerase
MKLKNKKIIVTGGAGFIGSHLVDMLVKKGAIVTVVDNLSAGDLRNLELSKNKIDFQNIDVRNFNDINKLIKNQDVVFHLAANADVPLSIKDPHYDFQNNIIGGYNILRSCLNSNIKKVIYASSAAVYGEPEYVPIDEKHKTNPISPYGAAKLAIERLGITYYKSFGLPFTAIRIFNNYGVRQPRYVMYDLIKKLYKNNKHLEVLGTGEQIRDYCYVEDGAKCFILAAENDKSTGEIFNLAGGNPIKIKDLVQLLIKTLGLENVFVKYTGQSWKGDIMELIADINKTKNDLGFEPRIELSDGIQRLHNSLTKPKTVIFGHQNKAI